MSPLPLISLSRTEMNECNIDVHSSTHNGCSQISFQYHRNAGEAQGSHGDSQHMSGPNYKKREKLEPATPSLSISLIDGVINALSEIPH
mmetsp:Transcript_8626/g.11557  ORF Transcript_8626/g.11557 Transcript_8626/m.11557 type:complete len:89 (+) Transcript_8626:1407-1673(+)